MSVENALLHNQVLDYAESNHEFERMLGRLLHEQTQPLNGDDFTAAIRDILAGLNEAMDQFLHEWDIIK